MRAARTVQAALVALMMLAAPRGAAASTAASRAAKTAKHEHDLLMNFCEKPPCTVTPELLQAAANATAQGNIPKAEKVAIQMDTTEHAVKIYLMAKNELTARDLTNFNEGHLKPVRGRHGAPPVMQTVKSTEQCSLPDGCVRLDKLRSFLHNKFIPGSDGVLTPLISEEGHMFQPGDHKSIMTDFRSYLLTRTQEAVPAAVRKMLAPDDEWPGGAAGGDRSPFFPKNVGADRFWETDLEALPQHFDGSTWAGQQPASQTDAPAEEGAPDETSANSVETATAAVQPQLTPVGKHRRLLK